MVPAKPSMNKGSVGSKIQKIVALNESLRVAAK